MAGVSIHAHVRGERMFIRPGIFSPVSFNPRPRAGRKSQPKPVPLPEYVSIHAHVRGERDGDPRENFKIFVFQSTPTCGAKADLAGRVRAAPHCFNPRPRAGRKATPDLAEQRLGVSIHAHVRGESGGDCVITAESAVFQSTPTCGAKVGNVRDVTLNLEFQSTPTCGAKVRLSLRVVLVLAVSIHAHVRGESSFNRGLYSISALFQSTPTCGAKDDPLGIVVGENRFQSTPTCGAKVGVLAVDIL